ncbi:hypothetical protein RhiirC2_718703 [Rhizophagus irregularis]|uniref:Ion transport domain-containing protein n=1 Tax=Rhizophagus irregularis TaxID=588596 RepID=A0A2N1MHD5_9GLOM|nr:hypothetical protein RhiirC2_718703 [Rhizophagus irregularis]
MEHKQRNNAFTKNVANYLNNFNKHKDEKDINYGNDDITMNKEVYQIELCLDGRFAATFDTANLRIKILQNTDYRPFIFNKKKNFRNENEFEESVEIDKTIAYFKIKDDFSIDKLYDQDPPPFNGNNVGFSDNDENETKKSNFRWSFDISNMHKNNDKYFIFVAVSRINIEEDMKGKKKDEDIKGNDKQKKQKKDDNGKSDYEREPFRKRIFNCSNEHENILSNDETRINISSTNENITATSNTTDESKKGVKKGVAIYRVELNEENYVLSAVTCYSYEKISGICKFIEASNDDYLSKDDSSKDGSSKDDSSIDDSSKDDSHNSELKRFTILNFRGIYNIEFNDDYDFLKLNEKFEYPQIIRFVLDHWLTFAEFADCTNRLLSCIYDKYFLVTRYKNSEQSLEVYDLAKMEHEIGARLVKNIVDEYIEYIFSVSRLQLCFTQVNTVKLFHIENGLEIASKKFKELEKIYLLEFIDSDKKLLIIGQGLKKGEDQKDELKVEDLEEGEDQESNKDKEDKKVLKFIIWDLYNTGEHELVELHDFPITKTNMDDIYTRLAITSGNILQIDDDGKVSSVLKKVENEINKKKLDKAAGPNIVLKNIFGKLNGKDDKNHTLYYDKNINFKQICNDREPWLPGGSKRTSYCLYYNEKGTETETLQLIVGKKFLKDDDLDFDEREYGLKKQENNDLNKRKPENDSMKQAIYYYCKKIYLYFFKREPKEPENNMELAIYYCRGRELKDAIKVAYLLEYYSRNPTNCVGWMCTVSKAIPLLFKYNYDDFARKLFIRCFAEGHLSGQDPDEIIPKGYLENYNSDIKFRALIPLVKLKSDESAKLKWFILLRDPNKNITIKNSTYSGNATNLSTNETLNITLKSDFNPKSSDDNPFSTFSTAMEAAYFWISGDWVQRDDFEYWAVDFFTLIASIFLVIILQNILIAFMNGVYTTAETKGKQKLLRYQANYIATFEALHIHFSGPEPEHQPKHIYYFSLAKNFEEWYDTRKGEQGAIYKDYEEEESSIFTTSNIFKERDYDEYSFLTYNDNIKTIVEDFINSVDDNTKNLSKRATDKNSIEEIDDVKDDLKRILEKLKKKYL